MTRPPSRDPPGRRRARESGARSLAFSFTIRPAHLPASLGVVLLPLQATTLLTRCQVPRFAVGLPRVRPMPSPRRAPGRRPASSTAARSSVYCARVKRRASAPVAVRPGVRTMPSFLIHQHTAGRDRCRPCAQSSAVNLGRSCSLAPLFTGSYYHAVNAATPRPRSGPCPHVCLLPYCR